VRLDFRLHDASGSVEAVVESNTSPESLAKPPLARDFPVCTATVTYAGEGYKAAMGWVQLMRSTDGASACKEFEMDPFEPLGPSAHPSCFFGFAPVLFDAPARPSREDLHWSAETFLCFVPMEANMRETRAILGFSWGLRIWSKQISLTPPTRLSAAEWNKPRPLLRREHPVFGLSPPAIGATEGPGTGADALAEGRRRASAPDARPSSLSSGHRRCRLRLVATAVQLLNALSAGG
jgi:hypothetical protein